MAKEKKAKTNKELEGFELKIDSFGEVKSSMKIDEINKFLNKSVDDKKLRDRDDLNDAKGEQD